MRRTDFQVGADALRKSAPDFERVIAATTPVRLLA